MSGAVNQHFMIRNLRPLQLFFVITGKGCGQTAYFDHAGALGCGIRVGLPGNMVGNQASLTVCRPGQRYCLPLPGNKIFHCNIITAGINIRQIGAHIIVGQNGTAYIGSNTGGLSQSRFRADADGQNRHIRRHSLSRIKNNAVVLKTFKTVTQIQHNTVVSKFMLQRPYHIFIKRR